MIRNAKAESKKLDSIMKSMDFFQTFSEKEQKEFSFYAKLKDYERGDHVFRDKESATFLFVVVNGYFTIYKFSNDGTRKVIFVLGPKDILNEEVCLGLPSSVSCEALSSGKVLAIPVNLLMNTAEQNPELYRRLFLSTIKKNRRLYRQLKNTGASIRIDKKIAAKLWKLSKDYGKPCPKGTRIEIKLNNTFLADLLGTTRESISRNMKILIEKNLILRDGSYVIVPCREQLESYFKEE